MGGVKPRVPCEACGKMRFVNRIATAPPLCRACYYDGARERHARMCELWREGRTVPEIMEALSVTRGAVSSALREARRRGEDVPPRKLLPLKPLTVQPLRGRRRELVCSNPECALDLLKPSKSGLCGFCEIDQRMAKGEAA